MYRKKILFNSEQIQGLNEICNYLTVEVAKRFYNLYYLNIIRMNKEVISKDVVLHNKWTDIDNTIASYAGESKYHCYFLEYIPNSFTRRHSDDKKIVSESIITLIDRAENTEGGEIILYHRDSDSFDKPYTINRYVGGKTKGQSIIPEIVYQNIGESVIYDNNQAHSVSVVKKGFRKVFVVWLFNGNKK